ncbi:MAG TPA: NAD(P)-dependent oxidoreductase, partial [Terriglobia bacterium]|nr:NAD(P)-dependent oxidoreductase [Terriglobia bacterium]
GSVRHYFERRRFDVVLHAATVRSSRITGEPPGLLADNLRMFFNLARHRDRFGRMFHFGSGAEFDRRHYRPRMSEDYFGVHTPADGYGFSKYVCAKYGESLEGVTNLRLFGVFGKYEDWRVRFISNACCRVIHGLPIVLRRDVLFDYLDVDDLAAIVRWFIDHAAPERAYNVCTGAPAALSALAGIVAEVSGRNPEIVVREPGLGVEYSGDNARLMAALGGFRFTEMRESVGRLYAWHEAHKHAVDPALLRFDG